MVLQVVEKVFSNLEKKDLLAVRRVCTDWHSLGTKAYINRESIMKPYMKVDQVSVQRFLDVMTPSKLVPAVRWDMVCVNLLDFSPRTFLHFLVFIAPCVRRIKMGFCMGDSCYFSRPGEKLIQLLSRMLDELQPDSLAMPLLEYFGVQAYGYVNVSPYREAVMKLTKKVVMGAKGLHTFRCDYPFQSKDGVIQALPKGLKELHFLFRSKRQSLSMTINIKQ